MKIIAYSDEYFEDWERFIRKSFQGTFLHSRRYLSYHEDKFIDRSLLYYDQKNTLVGVLVAASFVDSPKIVISHPGLTFGGLLTSKELLGGRLLATIKQTKEYYLRIGMHELKIKVVPPAFHRIACEDDIYALVQHDFTLYRCDLGSMIDLSKPRTISSRRKRSLKKALKNHYSISCDNQYLEEFWEILTANLKKTHGVSPTHSYPEISLLYSRFPDNISLFVALKKCKVAAGCLCYKLNGVLHAQYIAATPEAKAESALDLVFDYLIKKSTTECLDRFSFGISTVESGTKLNTGLYEFKTEFGSTGYVSNHFKTNL